MEDVFDLRVFIVNILRHWRVMIVLMLLSGILLGAFRAYQLRYMIRPYEIAQNVEISDDNIVILTHQRSLESLQDLLLYFEEITPEKSYALYFYLAIIAYNPEHTSQLLNIYLRFAQSVEFYEKISAAIDGVIPPEHMPEFVFVNSLPDVLRVSAIGGSPEFCISVANAAYEFLRNVYFQELNENK